MSVAEKEEGKTGDEVETGGKKPLPFSLIELKQVLDDISKDAGCRFVEQLLLLEMILSIDGTDATATKILTFLHKCNDLQPEHERSAWISERIPKTFKGLKRKVRERIKEINSSSEGSKAGKNQIWWLFIAF
jgi:hypothetical protein